MKRIGNIFDDIFTVDNLYMAYVDARRTKRARRGCFEFERSLGTNLMLLHEELMAGRYRPQSYHTFVIHEPKRRVIHAPAFRDCVVQHAIYRRVYQLFDRTFLRESYACRVGKGTHACADYVQAAMRMYDGDKCTLHMDVRRFFYSIDRAVLRALIERKIKDRRLVDCMMMFADHNEAMGIPIGNLLSQLYALIYLNPVDHYIKRELKVRHYARYVDDMLLIGLDRTESHEMRRLIEDFLASKLNLGLSKWSIQKIRHGVNFVGYRTWRTKRFVRKHSLYKFRRAARSGRTAGVISALAHARKTQSLDHMINYLREHHHDIYRALPKNYRRRHDIPAGRA